MKLKSFENRRNVKDIAKTSKGGWRGRIQPSAWKNEKSQGYICIYEVDVHVEPLNFLWGVLLQVQALIVCGLACLKYCTIMCSACRVLITVGFFSMF